MKKKKILNSKNLDEPDFIGIGVQRSGTTWAADILKQHPEICIHKKEISFFVQNFHKGYKWYSQFFANKGKQIAGEITVSYMITPRPQPDKKEFYPKWNPRRSLFFWRKQPSARDEILQHFPQTKIFAIFRNPVDRAWSHYWYWRRRKEKLGKKTTTFEQIFADDGRWIHTYGLYADLLDYWRKTFSNMGIFLYDDLKDDPLNFAQSLYSFLEVENTFTPLISQKINTASYEPMPSSTRNMLKKVYAEQIERFGRMINRDLSHWLRS
jgi:hypothetical protein